MNSYGLKDDRMLKTFIEKLLPAYLTYVVRKIVLGLILVNMFGIRLVSNRFAFDLEMSVGDREAWVWDLRDRLPRYRAQVEKIE